MTTALERDESIEVQIAAVERRIRHLKYAGTLVIVLLGCAFWGRSAPEQTSDRSDTIEARKIVLRDSDGTARCMLEVSEDGEVSQSFIDAHGNVRIRFVIDEEDISKFRLLDEEGSVRVGASTFPIGHKDAPGVASLAVLGSGSKGTSDQGGVFLSTTKSGEASQSVYDREGRLRISARAIPSMSFAAIEVLGDADAGQSGIQLCTAENGLTLQRFLDSNGKVRISTHTARNGAAAHSLNDSDETCRIRMLVVPPEADKSGAAPPGFATISSFDRKGRLRTDTSTFNSGSVSTEYYDTTNTQRIVTIVDSDGEASQIQADATGRIRILTGTYSDGQCGQAFHGTDGTCKVSTAISARNSVLTFVEADSMTQAWNAVKHISDIIRVGKTAKDVIDFLQSEE